jgi:hypothetical protein
MQRLRERASGIDPIRRQRREDHRDRNQPPPQNQFEKFSK